MKTPTRAVSTEQHHDHSPAARPLSLNCLSIDVEEYFHAEAAYGRLSPADLAAMQRRAAPFVERIADRLARTGNRATFFVLGAMVEHNAALLRRLSRNGHEIACHGDGHQHLNRLTPQELREDLRAARHRIEDAVGVRLRGYRAPTFSVTRANAWALDVILNEGFEYDASIFPIRHDRYGVPTAPLGPFWAIAPSGARIIEFPPLTLNWRMLRLPVGGGGYLRLLPGAALLRCVAARQRRREPTMIYIHPWELDPDQPRLPLGRLAQWRHRVNLHTTEMKLELLLNNCHFDTAANILNRVATSSTLPSFNLATGQTESAKAC